MKQIVVTGERVNSKKFEVIFDMLDDGVEAGKLEYIKWDSSTKGAIPAADGYIFIITKPFGDKQNHIHILPSDKEDVIISKVQKLGAMMKDLDNPAPETVKVIQSNQDSYTVELKGIVVLINGKEVRLAKEDLELIKALMAMCKNDEFEIKGIEIE